MQMPREKQQTTRLKDERPAQQRRVATEQKLIKAAIALFSKRGYDGSTTKDIAKKSGVNESLIIRYFGGKEGLFLETIRRFVEEKSAGPLDYPPQGSLADELICNVRSLLTDMEANADFYKILFGRSTLDAKLRKKISDILPKSGNPATLQRLVALRKKGKIPKEISDDLLMLIPFQAFATMLLAKATLNLESDFVNPIERLVRATVDGLVSSISK